MPNELTSLEIVNDFVDYWEAQVNKACRSNAENGYYDELDIAYFQARLKEYKTIKQDLEVLEIIKNKKVDIGYLTFYLKNSVNNKIALDRYNAPITKIDLTMEELLKIKQWLEKEGNKQC